MAQGPYSRGVVAAPHHAAAEAGRQILAEGGNAIEAMIAAAATIAAVYPHMTHVGGDGFWLIRQPNGKVHGIEACGFAGSQATMRHYWDRGLYEIPTRGPLAALTVPGAIGGWRLANAMAKGAGGNLPRHVLLEPAIRAARNGYAVSASQERLTIDKLFELKDCPGFADTFLVDGKAPAAGTMMKQTALAASLDHLARTGFNDAYRGDIGRELAKDLEAIGSPVTRDDLQAYYAVEREPLQLTHSLGQVFNMPPPTQGLASLMILGIVDRLEQMHGPVKPESLAFVHRLVEATKRAFMIRDRFVTDFDHLAGHPQGYLAADVLDREARAVSMDQALPWPQRAQPGDTIWMGAADSEGRVVSYIQSIYWEFGSGCVSPSTGFLMQNRGSSFALDEKALNPLQPGRRPFHTLNPALAALKDGRVFAYGTMGGEGQPQTQAMVFERHVRHGVPLEEALDRPRWLLGRTWGSSVTGLRLEGRFEQSLVSALERMGHQAELIPEAYSDTMGHAGGVTWHTDQTLSGAHDPRADGGAAGL
ncbi:gamma-glutamyltransferase [Phreatobacter aquaticus]|uniref:Gamma-glutamyltransferase n=1 Tax=Phreatobacter aquaticus TaxID=2570229 RepID=A0A4D7QFX1_9HYPH|nr:gamma-glutamyltransferase [Phreatobacter aquaticus]QCK85835.1 gamma-glutamyltransferase [Phreatobacter aquaticus]